MCVCVCEREIRVFRVCFRLEATFTTNAGCYLQNSEKKEKGEKDFKYTKKRKTASGLVSTKRNRHLLLLSKMKVMMKMIIIS